MKPPIRLIPTIFLLIQLTGAVWGGLEVGEQISLTIRGVDQAEVEQKGIIDRWKGTDAGVRKLLE